MQSLGLWIILFLTVVLLDWIAIGILWDNIRNFFHTKYSFFDISFIIIYFSEQLLLILLSVKYPQFINFWLGLFALVVITTASIQKLFMDSRDRKISELNSILRSLNSELFDSIEKMRDEIKNLRDENKDLIKYIEKKLD